MYLLIILLPSFGFSQVEVIWVDSIQDDFSFTEKWEYPEGVYLNQWNQLSCDGFCPMEIDALKDDQGRIYDDSLTKFYTIIDTTHRYFTHEGIVRAYEYGECHYAQAKIFEGKIIVDTEMNISTHSSLHIEIDSNSEPKLKPKARIDFNSIRASSGPIMFNAIRGKIEISKIAYEKGFIQLRVDLEFQHLSNDERGPQTWKGKMLVELTE